MSRIGWGLWVSVIVAAVPAAAPSAVHAQSLQGPKALQDIVVTVDPPQVKRGQTFVLNVDLTVAPSLHLQAHKPLQDFLIGTELKAPEVEGIVWEQAKYPPGRQRVDQFLGTLLEYTGHLRIQLPGRISPDIPPGSRDIQLSLQYQACNDQGSCFPPQTIPIQSTLQILPGQVAAEAIDARGWLSDVVDKDIPARHIAASAADKPTSPQLASRLPWQPFSTLRLADLTAAGKTVLIDFTADWCPNCKLNEFLALNTQATVDLVSRNGVVPLLADFTREDPEIRSWLGKFNSISVPLAVVVPAARPTEPIVLRDTYRQGTLLTALQQAGPSLTSMAPRPGLVLGTPLHLKESSGPVWWYLLAGLIGGFILNFMPCVLPVISIKVLSLLGQAGQAPRRVLGLGVSFAAGMIVLFLVLGLLVTVVGQTWGALFQSTTFLLVMLGILVAMTASLFGAFTFGVPAAVGDADAAIEGEGYVGSFGKGILAVLLGTPCSGPFLGSALAWAAGKSAAGHPWLGMLIFLSMGLGMALPFVILAARPNWMRFLPRPGPWMETFKQFMGFLLLLTVVYILSILESGLVKWAVLFAFGVAFASWLYGRLVRPDRSVGANWAGRVIAAGVVVAFAWASFLGSQNMRQAGSNSVVEKAGAVVEWPSR